MGWFHIDDEGNSFTGDLLWGDGPADLVGEVLDYAESNGVKGNPYEDIYTLSIGGDVIDEVDYLYLLEDCVEGIATCYKDAEIPYDTQTLVAGLKFSGWGNVEFDHWMNSGSLPSL